MLVKLKAILVLLVPAITSRQTSPPPALFLTPLALFLISLTLSLTRLTRPALSRSQSRNNSAERNQALGLDL